MTRSSILVVAGILAILLLSALAVWIALTSPESNPQRVIMTYLAMMTGLATTGLAVALTLVIALRRDHRRVTEIMKALEERRPAHLDGEWSLFAARVNAMLGELSRLEKERAESGGERERTTKLAAVGKLAAGLAHEIRNPITNVIGYASLCREKCEDPQLERDLRTIEEEARRCESITDSILAFSRAPVLSPEPVELSECFAAPPGLAVESLFAEGTERVIGDRVLLGRVFANLLSNAFEAGAKRIRVESERVGADAVFRLKDDGRGIPREMLETLFEPFQTSRRGGLGLGLALCRGIIQAHGGRITGRNRPEGGAEFEVVLPVAGPKR